MAINVAKEIAALQIMTVKQLREKYREVFGEVTRAGNKDFLFKRIIWRIQSLEEGDLSERARRRAAEIANDAVIRTTIPKPSRVSRMGEVHSVSASHAGYFLRCDRSCQDAPVCGFQKMPFMITRRSRGGRPVGAYRNGTNGSINAHCSSVSSWRFIVDLRVTTQAYRPNHEFSDRT